MRLSGVASVGRQRCCVLARIIISGVYSFGVESSLELCRRSAGGRGGHPRASPPALTTVRRTDGRTDPRQRAVQTLPRVHRGRQLAAGELRR